jgi:CMP-N-acetylneuraminic acid synthetase
MDRIASLDIDNAEDFALAGALIENRTHSIRTEGYS